MNNQGLRVTRHLVAQHRLWHQKVRHLLQAPPCELCSSKCIGTASDDIYLAPQKGLLC